MFMAVTFHSSFFNWIFLISWHTITNIALVLIIKKSVCNMSILYFRRYPNSIWSCLTTFKFTQRSSLHWNGLIFQNQVLYRTSFYQGLKTRSISKSWNLIYKISATLHFFFWILRLSKPLSKPKSGIFLIFKYKIKSLLVAMV